MKEANLPEPIFKNEREDFVVTFYNGEYPELYPNELKENKKIQDKKIQDKKIQDKKIQDRKQKNIDEILRICKEPKSVKEIIEELNYKSASAFRRDYIKPLIENGLLRMTIPDKPSSRKQKYISKT